MSYSTMLQSLPSPLRSVLRDPTYVAAIVSVGLHGLLWAVLPHLSLAGQSLSEAPIQREVGLVELTPEELARVPQFDSQPYLPLPIAPLPPVDAGRLPQPFSVTPLPTSPPLILPPSFYVPPPAPSSRVLVPQTPPRRQTAVPTTPVPPRSTPTPTPAPSVTPPPRPPIQQPNTSGRGSVAQVPALDNLQGRSGTPNQSPIAPTAPSSEPSPSAQASPSPSPDDRLLAENRADRQRLRRLLTPYPAGAVPIDRDRARVEFGDWFYRGHEERELEDLLTASVPAAYPREACRLRQNATVVYGVDINADDRVVGDPTLIFSSGYPVFDEAALAAVRRYNFNNTTSEEQPFQATVTFEYSSDVCPTASPGNAAG